jgi:hypothetical protein
MTKTDSPIGPLAVTSILIDRGMSSERRIVVGPAGDGDVEKLARRAGEKAMRAGHSVTWNNGVKQWIRVEVEMRAGHYVWNPDETRIRCTRTLMTKAADGQITMKKLRPVYKTWEAAWGE